MTLRRKNLLSKTVVVSIYGIMLAYAFSFAIDEYKTYAPNGFNSFWCFGMIGNLATILRLGPRIPVIRYVQDNKYILWIVLGLLLRYIRPFFDTTDPLPSNLFAIVTLVRGVELSLGLWKGFIRDWYNKKYGSGETNKAEQHVYGNSDVKKVS